MRGDVWGIGVRLSRVSAVDHHQPLIPVRLTRLGRDAGTAVPDILWSVREDPSDGVRRAAFRAFEAIGPAAAEAAPELIRAARNPKDPARTEALWALGGVRPRAELLRDFANFIVKMEATVRELV